MKKTRILAFALSAAIMAMGAGYAAWNETITINNNVNTGELNVEFIKQDMTTTQKQYPKIFIGDNTNASQAVAATASINQDNPHLTTVRVEKMYPGVTALYEVKIKNTGSIPAVIRDIDVNNVTSSAPLNSNLVAFGSYLVYQSNGMLKQDPRSAGVYFTTLNNLANTLNTALAGIRLEPGEYITFDATDEQRAQLTELAAPYGLVLPEGDNCMYLGLPIDADNSTENQTAEFQIKLNFKQFNQ